MWYRKQEIIKMDKQIERAGDDNKNNIGVLYGIGVGPGDPELMTLKAINTIKACDIIAIPAVSKEECYAYSIVQAVLPELEKKQIMCTPFPMIKDKEKLTISHNKIYSDIVCELEDGKNVAMLTIGDPSVYSTYMYIHKRVMQAGFTAVMISGVPSFCAAAARLGISLGEMMDEIHIIPASYDVRDTVGLRWNLCIHEIRKEACRAYRGASHRRCYQKKENDSVWCDKLWHGV